MVKSWTREDNKILVGGEALPIIFEGDVAVAGGGPGWTWRGDPGLEKAIEKAHADGFPVSDDDKFASIHKGIRPGTLFSLARPPVPRP